MKHLPAILFLLMIAKCANATTTPDSATRPAPALPADRDSGLRPFDQDSYNLAFEAFAATGDLESAYRIAVKAVSSAPESIEWRHRLARVATWTQRPEIAWAQWEYLFRHGDRSDEVSNALLALAPLAENPEIAIDAWKIRAANSPLSLPQWEALSRLFELAAMPQQGSRFFEQHYRRTHEARLLEYAGQLAKNNGEDERALQLYLERDRLKPFSPDATLQAAILLIHRDQLREAYTLMEKHRQEAPPEAAEFWRVLSHTAWQLAEFETAEFAYRNFTASPQATASEWSRLIALVRERYPERAAELALEAYRRNGGVEFLVMALSDYATSGNYAAQKRVFDSLAPEQVREAEGSSRFLILRAQYYQLQHSPDKAWNDFRHALHLSRGDSTVELPALWFVIDEHRKADLLAMLPNLRARAQTDPAYWLPLAAAYHTLDRFNKALFWYRKEVTRNPDDVLVLLTFADALDQAQQTGMADRVRRHCWLILRNKYTENELLPPLGRNQELLALARLTIFNQPGDPGLSMVRKIVGRLHELPPGQNADQQTADLVLSWAITKEQFLNANSWMWLHYARSPGSARLDAPLWAPSQAALQLNQADVMDKLLSGNADAMPIYNRYDTAHELGHWPQALDIAFQGMEGNSVDESLHDRYRQHAPLHSNYLQLMLLRHRYGTLDTRGPQLEARFILDDKLRLLLGWSHLAQSSSDFNVTLPVVNSAVLTNAEMRWSRDSGETYFAVFRRKEAEQNNGFRFDQGWTASRRLQLSGGIGYRVDAVESMPLQLAGYKNDLHAVINYIPGKREYVRVAPSLARYHTQTGDYLAQGRILDVEAGYRIRTEYPDWRVRGFATRQSFTYDGNAGAAALARLPQNVRNSIAAGSTSAARYFIPNGSTTWGACVDAGEYLAGQGSQDIYSRAWRPFFSVCKSVNTVNGSGYNSSIGIGGSVSGEDHLSIRFGKDRGGPGDGALNNTLDILYRHYF